MDKQMSSSSTINVPIRCSIQDLNSPAKQKAANRATSIRRARLLLSPAATRVKLLGVVCILSLAVLGTSKIRNFMGWRALPVQAQPTYTLLINTWKQKSSSPLKQTLSHYASCPGPVSIHVSWNEPNPPSEDLKSYINRVMSSHSKSKVVFHHLAYNAQGGYLDSSSRFKPIEQTPKSLDAVFSVDDGVIVPCSDVDFAFQVWRTAPNSMVGFVPRMHWLLKKNNGNSYYYKYGGWWSVWWTGTYSMVLSKAAFIHKEYLSLYTHSMPPFIQDYVSTRRNCEDIAMSMLVANATGTPPLWVKGKVNDLGSSGLSSLRGYGESRNDCLNDLISLYGSMPLIPTNAKAVDARHIWFW